MGTFFFISKSKVLVENRQLTSCNSDNVLNCGPGMIYNQDPLFVNTADLNGADNVFATAVDSLRLRSSSPSINQGSTEDLIQNEDLTGQKHINIPDIGAYEYPCSDIQQISLVPIITNEFKSQAATETLQATNVISPTSKFIFKRAKTFS